VQAIAAARHTITFETYIYWSGQIGEQITEALCERARAGVKVHVTVDWLGSLKMDAALIDRMRQAGVQVQMYRPLTWYNLDRVNNRTHRKLLVIDGRVGFTGGVGIADQWSGHAQDPEHWRDSHFRIEGPAVAQLQAAFNDNWIKTTGATLSGEAYFPALEPEGDSDAHLFLASPQGGSESMHLMYLMAIAAAGQRIDLAASYFVPDRLLIHALLEARQRGVAIRVLVPGEHIDSDTVGLASRADWGPMLAAGITIAEYQPTMLHVKMLIIDGELVSVGSTNFDVRSFRLNDEASMNIYDRVFATQMTAVFEADLAQAKVYSYDTWQQRPLREKFFEAVVRPLKSQL
jgi:cardiolipin synthase